MEMFGFIVLFVLFVIIVAAGIGVYMIYLEDDNNLNIYLNEIRNKRD